MDKWMKALLLGVGVGLVMHLLSQPFEEQQDLALVFHQLDENADGLLSLEEFLALQPTVSQGGNGMVVQSFFTPLQTDTMDKDLQEASLSLKGLLDWQRPAKSHMTLSHDDILALLPPHGIQTGDIWYMVEPSTADGNTDLSTRYSPIPPTKGTAAHTLHKLLSMFHPNIFIQTRFKPRGTVAILRAHNKEFLDIVFRCHAEFQLNQAPLLSFWFTPGQFIGHLTVARNGSPVTNFSVVVPSDKKLNVDMEWMNKVNENMEVDIGFLPLMKLEKFGQNKTDVTEVEWEDEISFSDAQKLLEKKMFPFKEVTYHPVEKAIKLSSDHQLLLHCIVLWGALDDQSC